MEHYTPVIILISGFIFDLILGDPNYRFHPVRIIGNVIDRLHKHLKRRSMNQRFAGILLALLTIIISVSVYSLLVMLFYLVHPTAAILIKHLFCLFPHCP